MNFQKDKFLFKELVNTFTYTTATKDREACVDVSINGRKYTKYGTLQAVTFVGNLYKMGDQFPHKYILCIGVSKQHPCDTKVNKNLGYEIAMENALDNPCMMIEVQGKLTNRRFNDIVIHYLSTMEIEFIKTRQEILLEGKNPQAYIR